MATQTAGSRGRSATGQSGSVQKSGGREQASNVESTSDRVYGVVSVLYHALQGADTYQQYIRDARRDDDDELAQFFEDCRTEEEGRARRAKSLLLDRLEDELGGEEGDE